MLEDKTSFDTEPEMFDEEVEEDEDIIEDEETDETEVEESESAIMTIKYNGKEEQLTQAQAIELAQKGKNYDHVFSELESYRNGAIGKAMKAYAEQNNMSVDEYAQMLLSQTAANALSATEKELREKYPDAPQALIKELAESKTRDKQTDAKVKTETEERKAWAEALRDYPDLTMESIPADVLEAVKAGKQPLLALKEHDINELKDKLKAQAAQEGNLRNKQKSIGTVKGIGGGAEKDPFLEGLMG